MAYIRRKQQFDLWLRPLELRIELSAYRTQCLRKDLASLSEIAMASLQFKGEDYSLDFLFRFCIKTKMKEALQVKESARRPTQPQNSADRPHSGL